MSDFISILNDSYLALMLISYFVIILGFDWLGHFQLCWSTVFTSFIEIFYANPFALFCWHSCDYIIFYFLYILVYQGLVIMIVGHVMSFPAGASSKEPACQCRRHKRRWFDSWVGRSPGGGNGNPLQCSCLENAMDEGAWQTTYSPQGREESDVTKST